MKDDKEPSVGGDMSEVMVEKETIDCDECASEVKRLPEKKRRQCKICSKI